MSNENKDSENYMRISARTITRSLDLLERINDPATKAQMLLQHFYNLVVVASVFFEKPNLFSKNVSQEVSEEMNSCSKIIMKNLVFLMDWVQNPVYSPDHTLGKQMMNDAGLDFESKKE